jgi:hypothetical protein
MRLGYLLLTVFIASCAGARVRSETPTKREVGPVSQAEAPAPRSVTEPKVDDLYLAVPNVLDELNRARAEHGIAPVRLDRALCALAQHGTAVFFQYGGRGAGAEQRTANVLASELDRFRHVYRRVKTAVLDADALSNVTTSTLQPAMDAEMAYVGIAVEEQRSEKAIVLIFAQ